MMIIFILIKYFVTSIILYFELRWIQISRLKTVQVMNMNVRGREKPGPQNLGPKPVY